MRFTRSLEGWGVWLGGRGEILTHYLVADCGEVRHFSASYVFVDSLVVRVTGSLAVEGYPLQVKRQPVEVEIE